MLPRSSFFVVGLLLSVEGVLNATAPPRPGHQFPPAYLEYLEAHPEHRAVRGGLERWVEAARAERIKLKDGLETAASEKAAVSGTVRVPVIPVAFSNVPVPPAIPVTRLREILFDGPNPPDGTVTDYYDEVSYGLLTLTGDVYPYVTLPQTDTFYEGGSNGLPPAGRTGQLLTDALTASDPSIDFRQYDNDGPDRIPNSGDDDGFVDQVAFIHAESGGECSTSNLWAHRTTYQFWSGGVPFMTNDPAAGGGTIRIRDYFIQGGLNCLGQEMDIGTFAHETGHIFGLPDLYDTKGDSQGLGFWSLMASGSWNTQSSPAHLSAWEKEYLGWLNADLVEEKASLTLHDVETTPDAYRIEVGNGEYFLLENRQPIGFDQHLKTCGLAIYHVHEATILNNTSSNAVNNFQKCGAFVQQAQAQYGIALEQADGLCQLEANSNRGDAGDLFPGSSNKTSFTGGTNPNTNNYNPSPTSVGLSGISSCGNVMTVNADAFALPPPVAGKLDVVFLIDRTGSYTDDDPHLKDIADEVANKIATAYPGTRFGVATFRDFPFSPFGAATDEAYKAVLPLTTDINAFASAIQGLSVPDGGGDLPESQYEAVFQALTGLGRDLNNDSIAGGSPGEIAPSSLGWAAGRHRVLYLFTDAEFHDSDVESYPGTALKAIGRNAVRSHIAMTFPPSQLTIFTLISDEPGVFVNQGEDGSVAPVNQERMVEQAQELGTLTGGGVLFVGPDSSGLEDAIDTSLAILERSDTEAAGCVPGPTHLCLNDGRFRIQAIWEDFSGNTGDGQAVHLTGDTGYFWFFDPANVELVLKVLDGRPLNDRWWVFYGALSSVSYTILVTDTVTGQTRAYHNDPGNLASVADTSALPGSGSTAAPAAIAEGARSPAGPLLLPLADAATEPCISGFSNLCLNGNRFKVEVQWKDFVGNTGTGQALALTSDTGYFWFFSAANVELVLKVLDGRPINGKWWVFYGALSNVEYTITVTDTMTGTVRRYNNPSGNLASQADTAAFPGN